MRTTTELPALLLLSLVILSSTALTSAARTIWVDGGSTAGEENGSSEAPFTTIAAAVAAVRPGDVVTVRAGVYRERFSIPSGEPGRPVTLRAAEGQRVVVSGCVPLEGWKPEADGRWSTIVDWRPRRLLAGSKPQTIAREPNAGWWQSVTARDGVLADPRNLRGIQAAESGGEIRIWLRSGNTFATCPIDSLDTQSGRVKLGQTPRPVRLTDGDKYYLQNRAELIDGPGQWAVEPHGEQFKVFFMPHDPADLQKVECPKLDRGLVHVRGAGHIRIEGLEVTGGQRFGIEVHDAQDVIVRRCTAHNNGYMGISLREAKDCLVEQNLVRLNEYGISVGFSNGVTVRHNDVGYNGVDGILVTWKSDNVAVRRNFVHHHLLWGHPDNLQVYRGVTNVTFEENLLLSAGQSVMMEETSAGRFVGNMVVGCGAYMLIMGHQNAGHYEIRGNTLAFAGYGCMNLTWEDYDVRENVMMTGHGSALFGTKGIHGYRGDRNLFWNSTRAENPTIIATDDGWHRDFRAVKNSTGQDERSVYADPRFRNAPVAFGVLDSRRLHESTRDTWHMRGGGGAFKVGDHVEVNFDGVRRRVTRAGESTITVAPGLEEEPAKGWLVANWADNTDFRLDLRLRDDSPGAKLAADGGPVGSKIDIEAFLRGDFDGDGRRDVPRLPPEM